MNTLRSNILSNFASKAVLALGMLVFTPIYLHLLGLEAYGLIGFWATARGFLTLLDFGMSTTLNREIAAARASQANVGHLWNTLRTLEAVSWTLALGTGLVFALLAPWAGHHWLNLGTLPVESAVTALMFLSCAASFQLPTILYQGGLTGLERQVSMNSVIVVCSLVRDLGAIAVLHLFPTTVVTFFAWQALVSAGQCFAQRIVLARALPAATNKPRFDSGRLNELGKFTAGTGLISLTVMFIGLADGILLPRFVSLDLYGTFSLCQVAAGAILILVSPMTTAAFPRFVALVVKDQPVQWAEMYHEFAQLIAVAIFPLAAVLVGFSSSVLFVWTGSTDVARRGHVALATIALATAFNALLYLPLQAQYAARWTSLTLTANAVSVVLFIPTIVLLASNYGIEGASYALLALMVGQFCVIPPLMFRRILRGAGVRWYLNDVLVPVFPSLVLGLTARLALRLPESRIALASALLVLWIVLVAVTLVCTPLALGRVRALAARRRCAV